MDSKSIQCKFKSYLGEYNYRVVLQLARQGSLRNFYRETLVVQIHSARSDEIKTGVKRIIFLNIFLLSITRGDSLKTHSLGDLRMPSKIGGVKKE